MSSNEHVNMHGNPMDDPFVCEICDRTVPEDRLYGSANSDMAILCSDECVEKFDEKFPGLPEGACKMPCHRCIGDFKIMSLSIPGLPLNLLRMILCDVCGNKRCPRASDHRLACTGSNEPGQEGSIYQVFPKDGE